MVALWLATSGGIMKVKFHAETIVVFLFSLSSLEVCNTASKVFSPVFSVQ
jgi:hypothetical protein